jgi:2-dehydropantoate 2-reductase
MNGLEVFTTSDFLIASTAQARFELRMCCVGTDFKPAGIASSEPIGDCGPLVRECLAVGRAEGASLDDALIEGVLNSYRNGPADAINSLHADRLAGRLIEIDARNGAIVRLGRRHGVATPVNQMVVALLDAASGAGWE